MDRRYIWRGPVAGQGGRFQDAVLSPAVQHTGIFRVHPCRAERQYCFGQLLRVQNTRVQRPEHAGDIVFIGREHRCLVLHPGEQGRYRLLELVPERGRVFGRHKLPSGVRQSDAGVPKRSQSGQNGNPLGDFGQIVRVPVPGPRPQRNQFQSF